MSCGRQMVRSLLHSCCISNVLAKSTNTLDTGTHAIHPRTAGQMLAFASSTTNLRLYSVHDGKTLLSNSPLASSDSSASSSSSASPNSLYLVSWQECIPPEQRIKREKIMAEELGNALPGLPAIVQQADDANVKA